jgi:RNase P/RNase MRP subunit p29
VHTIAGLDLNLKIKSNEAVKYFEVGESVRIAQGSHTGESGIISQIINEKYAKITLDDEKGELQVLLLNLRNKNLELEKSKLVDTLQKGKSSVSFLAGDVVCLDSH